MTELCAAAPGNEHQDGMKPLRKEGRKEVVWLEARVTIMMRGEHVMF